jgi:hypothetical protein
MVKLCSTSVAALYVASPVWLARSVQVPVAIKCTLLPVTEQVVGVWLLKLIAKPELAVALILKSASVSALLLNAPNVMVWLFFTVVLPKLLLTPPTVTVDDTLLA